LTFASEALEWTMNIMQKARISLMLIGLIALSVGSAATAQAQEQQSGSPNAQSVMYHNANEN
jgi:chitodextrinase